MPRGNQFARQQQLLQLIDHLGGIAVEDAALTFDCTIRSTWRDLEVLERADKIGRRAEPRSPAPDPNRQRLAQLDYVVRHLKSAHERRDDPRRVSA
jgi:DeoR/GlpR family transcriptional regulator of sugar metabolism